MNERIQQQHRCGDQVLDHTLSTLHALYKENHIRPGRVSRLAVKPLWNVIIGSQNECGITGNRNDNPALYSRQISPEIRRLQGMIGKPLFEIAETGMRSDNILDRSFAIAAMIALSQPFLGCSAVRKRGYHAQCWMATDSIVQKYPMISRLLTRDDVVAFVGYDNLARSLRRHCRALHVIDKLTLETFRTVIIDHEISYGPGDIALHRFDEAPEVLGTADVVLLPASSLVDNSFCTLLDSAKHARLVGIYGLGGALIPDEFFMHGVDFISSFRVDNTAKFIEAMQHDPDMAHAMKMNQRHYMVMRPDADCGQPPEYGRQV